MKKMHVKLVFIEPVLGTAPNNKDLYTEFIASKAPDAASKAEEIEAIGADAVEEKGMTVFPRDENGQPIIWNHQVKGFFKEACSMLKYMKGEKCAKESNKIKAHKKVIDGCIEPVAADGIGRGFVLKRKNPKEPIAIIQRPLRGQTAQGERIALASSEQLPAGTTVEFWVRCPDGYVDAVREWLNYGKFHGMLQWRNAGNGRFNWLDLGVEDI